MVMKIRPDETFQEVIERGLTVFKGVIQGVTDVLRAGDGAIRELDGAMRGTATPLAAAEPPEETFLNVVTLIRGAMDEARERGTATAAGVVQKAREALNRVTATEPSWRPAPSIIRTAADMFRTALRDLRGSESLVKLATGRGGLGDLENLINWAEDAGSRIEQAQKVVPTVAAPVVATQTPAENPKKKAKKSTKSKKAKAKTEAEVQNIVFQAIANASGNQELKEAAEKVSQGKIPPDEFADSVTRHLENGQLSDSMMNKAKKKAIHDGVDSKHPLLGF